ncbi:MAG: hypothetical protein Q4D80_03095 [Pseudomonadota bacterium]|nr:hypothetical protein [Pseudomonadota bacterium]
MDCINVISILFSTVSLAFLLMAEGVVNNKFSKKRLYPFIFRGSVAIYVALLVIFEVYVFLNGNSLDGFQLPDWVAQVFNLAVLSMVMFGSCLFVSLPYRYKMDKFIVIVLLVVAIFTSGISRAMLL